MSAAIEFRAILNKDINSIKRQMASRCHRSANALRNAALDVLKGSRGGKRHRVPGTRKYYNASAPGSPPAVRTGTFRNSWQPTAICDGTSFISRIETNVNVNGHNLGAILEYGTSKMAPRPHHDRIREKALPKIREIYSEPYF